jgi:hypothetical protein
MSILRVASCVATIGDWTSLGARIRNRGAGEPNILFWSVGAEQNFRTTYCAVGRISA